MVVQGNGAVAETFLTNRVEGTTDRLAEAALTVSIGFLESTETTAWNRLVGVPVFDVVIAGKDTVFAPYDASDEVAVAISISHSLFVNNSLCRSR